MSWEADLDRLVTDRGPALVAYAYLLVGDMASAEDLVQDAIVRTYSRRRPEEITWVEAYVRRVILHTDLDGHRERTRFATVSPLVATPESVADQVAAAGDRADVARALTVLSPRQRACVVLRFYDDLTLPEIGLRLGVSAGAVKRYLSDARSRLEPLLGPQVGLTSEDVATITTEGAR